MPILIKTSNQALRQVLQPNIEEWPIYQLERDKTQFIEQLTDESMQHIRQILGNDPKRIMEEVARTMYLERIRIKNEPWAVDPKDEKPFWNAVNEQLIDISRKKPFEGETDAERLLFRKIISRYAHEIPGHFNVNSYRFATKAVPLAVSRLLNAASARKIFFPKIKIHDRLQVTGDIDLVRALSLKGTILLTPTHFSNLDSILVGWIISSIGLPAFLYGGGLNLFNSPAFRFFLERLGPYKVDRRKKSLLYIETLKTFSRLTLERGCHSLFFPGGTRARSGQIESYLKLGLLGSALDAQCQNVVKAAEAGNAAGAKKIFVVPLAINYHFVLEASQLIEQHLRQIGREKYFIDSDTPPSLRKLTQFFWKFFAAKSEAILSFGAPMDVFGNRVDAEGTSLDQHGCPINIADYFRSNGTYCADTQRDAEYTRMLGDEIVRAFHRANTVLASHLVAFVAFEILSRKHRRLDLYGLLRLPEEDRQIPFEQLAPIAERVRNRLRQMSEVGEVQLSKHLHGDITRIIEYGIINLGIYHTLRPLKLGQDRQIMTENMNLLYYYHNRLMGYKLEELI
jgi:glycerol-3-phosphate O-acyltransferase